MITDAVAAELRATIDGQTYEFAPISVRGWGRLTRWAQEHYLGLAAEQVQRVKSHADKQVVMDRAYAFVSRFSLFNKGADPEGHTAFSNILQTFDGFIQLLRESALQAQRRGVSFQKAEITEEFMFELLERAENVADLAERVMVASQVSIQKWAGRDGEAKKSNAPAALD